MRRLRKLADWRRWASLADDARLTVAKPCPAPGPAAPALTDVRVRWPTRYWHPVAAQMMTPILDAFSTSTTLSHVEIAQPYRRIVVIELDAGSGSRRIAFDHADSSELDQRCLEEVDVYFKLQHRLEGYGTAGTVFPAGYVTHLMLVYRHWCRWRRLRSRSVRPQQVFGRFRLEGTGELRRRAIELLRRDQRIDFNGGTELVRNSWYLRELAHAGVSVDLPGNGSFCYRLIESMALGCCIVGPPHSSRMPVPLRAGVELVNCREDLSDLADLCAHYSEDRAAAAAIGDAAAAYFDAYLHPQQLVSYYVETVRG